MITESNNHKTLKKVLKHYYQQFGFTVKKEERIESKIVDLAIYHRDKLVGIIECIHRQSISKVRDKLLSINLPCKKEIARIYKKTSPYGRKLIKDLKEKDIIFTQIIPIV